MRLCIILTTAIFLLPGEALALAPGQQFGVSDQRSTTMVDNPLYQALKPTISRYTTDWNTALTYTTATANLDAWYQRTITHGQQALIALGAQYQRKAPSVQRYRQGFMAMVKRYPLAQWAIWNEANHSTQPTYKKPKLVASYYIAAKKSCARCTIVGLTAVLGGNAATYTRHFQQALPKKLRAHLIWGAHNYGDVNRCQTSQLRAFLRLTKGPVWLTESGAWAQFTQTWPFDTMRQAQKTHCVFNEAKRYAQRIRRLYWYQWQGTLPNTNRWDSGLLNADGTPRPAYTVALQMRFR